MKSYVQFHPDEDGFYDDYFINDDELGLYVVCDGMGGHPHPKIASSLTANALAEYFFETKSLIKEENVEYYIKSGVDFANHTLLVLAKNNQFKWGSRSIGSTLDFCLMFEDFAYFAHVGDSSSYHYRNKEGVINVFGGDDSPEFKKKMFNGFLSSNSYIGKSSLELRYVRHDVKKGDKILLITDGISKLVFDEEIEHCLSSDNSGEMIMERAKKSRMASYLKENCGELYIRDSATALVVEV